MQEAQSKFLGVVAGPDMVPCGDTRQYIDRRNAPRKLMCAAGLVSCEGLAHPVPCKVVDFSGFGARLVFDADSARYQLPRIQTPQKMRLTIVAERTEAECAIVWRAGAELGVRLKYAFRQKSLAS